jgi:hypothetical protein
MAAAALFCPITDVVGFLHGGGVLSKEWFWRIDSYLTGSATAT